jgi:hypothetical protein
MGNVGEMTLAELGAKLEADGLELSLRREVGLWWCRLYRVTTGEDKSPWWEQEGEQEERLAASVRREGLSAAVAAAFELWEEG